MSMNAQMLEILGWLLITLYTTLPEIFHVLSIERLIMPLLQNKRLKYLAFVGTLVSVFFSTRYSGYLIGAFFLYYSRDYGVYAFSFLIVWIGILFTQKIILNISKKKQLYLISYLLKSLVFIALFVSFGIHFQTEIWFITATLYTLLTTLAYLHGLYIKDPSSELNPAKSYNDFLPGLIIPFSSILYVFDIGILGTETLHTFYSVLLGGFFALLGIVAMFGVFILRDVKCDRNHLHRLFKGLIFLYIIAILILTLGLITLPKNSENEASIDLSHNTLIPDSPFKDRQLSGIGQIFGKIVFAAAFALLISSLAYLYKIVSEILKVVPYSNTEHKC